MEYTDNRLQEETLSPTVTEVLAFVIRKIALRVVDSKFEIKLLY